MERLMLLPCLVCLLVALVCPVRAEEGISTDIPMDGIVGEDPAPVEPPPTVTEPVPDQGQEGDSSVPPVDDGSGVGGLDGIDSSAVTTDYTAVVEALTGIQDTLVRLETVLSYIFVSCLFFFVVSAGKLIYSFFNMFF